MANAYFYSNVSVATSLSSSITAGATSITVDSATGFPSSFPYILALDYEQSSEELVKVTAGSGTSLTVERGFGGTSAQSHSLGAAVRHVVNAQDLTDFRTHEADGTAVHGLAGDVVGTSDTQTLTNKTLTSPTVDGGALSGTLTGAPTLSGAVAFSGAPTFTGAPVFTGTPQFNGGSTGAASLTARVAADAFPRLTLGADGLLTWGDGAAAGDTTLFRDGAGVLRTDDTFRIGRPTATDDAISIRVGSETNSRFLVEGNGKMFWGNGAGAADAVLGGGPAPPPARPPPTDDAISIRVGPEPTPRFLVEGNGKMFWGNGAGAADAVLERTAASTLATDAKFSAQVETSSTFTVANGYSLVDCSLARTCGIASVTVTVNVETGFTTTDSNTSNVLDHPIGTIPSGYRPNRAWREVSWSNGITGGTAVISTDGVVTLRTATRNAVIDAGTNIRFSDSYIL